MSNSRKIKIFADAANLGSAKSIETNDLLNFRRGDSLEIQAAFLENGKIRDMSGAVSATLEILDIGGFNAVNPRSVSLLMRAEASEFSEIDSGASDLQSLENLHAAFNFTQRQTSVAAGEKWLRLFADFADGSRITFASGWIVVSENYSSEPNLLPIENPVYYTKADADETFLAAAQNLGDLPSAASARGNLGVYSKAETQALVNAAAAGSHTHSAYLEKSANLADVSDAWAALQNIGGVSSGAFNSYKNSADAEIAELARAQSSAQKDISRLGIGKAEALCAEFCGGDLRTKNIPFFGGCYSFCFNLKMKSAPSAPARLISAGDENGENYIGAKALSGGIELRAKQGGFSYCEFFGYSDLAFEFGAFNSVVCVFDCKLKALKLFVGGVLSEAGEPSGQWGEWSGFSAQFCAGDSSSNCAFEMSKIKIYNADLSEFGYYGVSNFHAGEREPDFLLRGINRNTDPDMGASTGGGWAATGTRGVWNATLGTYRMSYIANADLTGDAEAAGLGIAYAVDLSTKPSPEGYGAVSGLNNTQISLLPFAGKTIKIRASFYAKKVSADNNSLQIRTGGATSGNTARVYSWAASNFNASTWTKIDEVFEFAVPASTAIARPIAIFATGGDTASYRVANFQFEVLGALASFQDIANSNQIKDNSSNLNDAYISAGAKASAEANPAHCRESLSWAGTMATQEGFVDIPKNSAVRIFAKSTASAAISASVNSVSKTADLPANALAEIGEWIAGEASNAEFSPSALFTGKIDIFYKIERM